MIVDYIAVEAALLVAAFAIRLLTGRLANLLLWDDFLNGTLAHGPVVRTHTLDGTAYICTLSKEGQSRGSMPSGAQ